MSKWNADHMCDEGIQEVVNDLLKEVRHQIREAFDKAKVQNDVLASIIVDTVAGEDENTLEKALVNIVTAVDEQMQTVSEDVLQKIEESGDYISIDCLDDQYIDREEHDRELAEKDEEISSLELDKDEEMASLESQIYDMENQISDLEDKIEEGSTVHPSGHLEPLTWVPGRELFVDPRTGRTYKLVETKEPVSQ